MAAWVSWESANKPNPEIKEIDINPFAVDEKGGVVSCDEVLLPDV